MCDAAAEGGEELQEKTAMLKKMKTKMMTTKMKIKMTMKIRMTHHLKDHIQTLTGHWIATHTEAGWCQRIYTKASVHKA